MNRRELVCGTKTLRLPSFFASVSSVKTNFSPSDYLSFLEHFGFPSYLISAYDLIMSPGHISGQHVLNPPRLQRDSVVLLDSGNYEAYWLRDRGWDHSAYLKAASLANADLVLSFDDPWHACANNHEHPSSPSSTTVVPIVHGDPQDLPQKVGRLAESLETCFIALPERELGDGIIQRASTLRQIRSKLDSRRPTQSIHLLGTGNPMSILVYVACGADSFDGLEWCQTVVDHKSARLLHFSQRDLIGCECSACTAAGSYSAVTLGHNLLFYLNWMERIQREIEAGSITDMLQEYLPRELVDKIT